MKNILSKINFKHNLKIVFLGFVGLILISLIVIVITNNSHKVNESASISNNGNEELKSELTEQQIKIDELQKFKDEQMKIEEEKRRQEEDQKLLAEQSTAKNKIIEQCRQKNELCKSQIYDIKKVKYSGNHSSFLSIDDASKQIKSLEKNMDGWQDNKKTCDSGGSEQQVQDCEDMLDKIIKEAGDDIEEIKKIVKKTENELEVLINSERCKNYEKSCE